MRNCRELAVPSQDGCPSGFERLVSSLLFLRRNCNISRVFCPRGTRRAASTKPEISSRRVYRYDRPAGDRELSVATDRSVGDGRRNREPSLQIYAAVFSPATVTRSDRDSHSCPGSTSFNSLDKRVRVSCRIRRLKWLPTAASCWSFAARARVTSSFAFRNRVSATSFKRPSPIDRRRAKSVVSVMIRACWSRSYWWRVQRGSGKE